MSILRSKRKTFDVEADFVPLRVGLNQSEEKHGDGFSS